MFQHVATKEGIHSQKNHLSESSEKKEVNESCVVLLITVLTRSQVSVLHKY